ncbi:uncharacterized protein V1518DRAFT_5607 [Limtongia smithiae]|uniref:uncharacterized protein n=1 Tax=Limtongia smithiae TaxID=1125753 RepID=UPI0034CD129F
MNRGPLVLTIEEAEYLLDQLPPPPSPSDNSPSAVLARKVRMRLLDFLHELRKGAEGSQN